MTDIATLGIAVNTSQVSQATTQLGFLSGAAGGATNAILALTAAFSGFQVVDKIVKFQDAMLGLKAVSSATNAEMVKLEKQARTLGATSVFSATQVGNAQKFLAQAGFDTNEVLKSTSATLKLASAGSLDLATAADIASNVVGGMRLEVADLDRVVNVLASTARLSNTNVTQLGGALAKAAPLAAAAGVSIEEVSAAIGILSNNGIQAEVAATGLGGILRQLTNLTPKAEAVLNKYGIKASQVSVQTNGLSSVLNTLGKVTLSAGDAITVFQSEAAAAGLVLGASASDFDKLTDSIKKDKEAADEMSGIISSELSGAFKSLGSALDEAVIQLGKGGVGGALEATTNHATALVSAFTGMLPIIAENNDLSAEYVKNMTFLADAIKAVGLGVAAYVVINATMVLGVKAATLAMIALNAATVAGPWGLLAIAVGAAAVGIAAYVGYTQDATKATKALTEVIEDNSIAYDNQGRAIDLMTKKKLELAVESSALAIKGAETQIKSSQIIIEGYQDEIQAARLLLKARTTLAEGDVFLSPESAAAVVALDEEIKTLHGSIEILSIKMGINGNVLSSAQEDYKTLKDRLDKLNESQGKGVTSTGKLSKAQKALNKLIKDGARVFSDTRTPLEDYNSELKKLEILSKTMNPLTKEMIINQDTYGRALAAAKKELEDATGVTKENEDALKASEDALKAIQDQQQETFDSWSDNITSIITGTSSLKSVLNDLAKTLLQKAFVNPLLISVGIQPAGGTAGSLVNGASGVGGAGGIFSGIKNVLGSGGNFGFGGAFGDFATSGFGSSIGLSNTMIDPMSLQSVNTLSGTGSFLQNGLSNFGVGSSLAGLAGGGLANLLGLGEGGSGLGGTAGGLIGTFFGGPLGSGIGSFVGTALDGLLGGSNNPTEFSFTSQDDEERFEGRNAKTLSNEFGETLFKVFRGRSEDTKIVEAMTPILQTISSLESSIASVLTSEQIAAATVGVASADFSAEDPDEAINQFVGARLGAILDQLDPVFAELVDKTELVGVQSLQYAASLVQINEGIKQGGPLIDLFGGSIESTAKFLEQIKGENETIAQSYAGLIAVQNSYYQNFFSEEERAAKVTAAAQEELDKLNNELGLFGAAALDTKQEFRSYIESLDGTTEAGRIAIEAALGYQGALLAVADASKQATNNLSAEVLKTKADVLNKQASDALDLAKASFDVVKNAVSLEKQVITNSIKELSNVISGATSARNTLRASNSVTNSIDRTAAQDLINRARSGENIESTQLTRALSVVSKPSKDLFSSFTDYQRDFFSTSISIADLKNTSMDALTAEELELERLSGIEETAKAQLDALLGINTSVLGLNDALSVFATSLAASKTATAAASTASTASTGDTFRTFVDSISSEYRSNQETGGTGRLTNDEGLQIYNYAASNGISLDQVDDLLGFTGDQAKTFAEFNNLPVFANGGSHTGGLRLVGERGPELEMTGPSRIMNNSDLKSAIGGKDNNSEHESKMNMILSKMQLIIDRIYRQQTQWTNDALNVRVVT